MIPAALLLLLADAVVNTGLAMVLSQFMAWQWAVMITTPIVALVTSVLVASATGDARE